MMYNEFLEKFGCTESYITYAEYTEKIEPIYMNMRDKLSQREFCDLLHDAFEKIVYPTVKRAFKAHTTAEKVDYINGNSDLGAVVEKVDEKARYIAYDYTRLIASI